MILSLAPTTPSYVVERIPHERFTARLNTHRISGPLRVVPEPFQAKGFRSSGLSTCLRQTGYRLLKITPTQDTYNPDNLLAADQGTALHVRVQEQLVGAGMVYTHPTYLAPGRQHAAIELSLKDTATDERLERLTRWNLSGHIDAVLADKHGNLAIFDLKTGKPDLLNPRYEYLPEKLESYAVQTTSYMAHYRAPDGRQATTAYVYMISRGDTRTRALYRVSWQPERWAIDAARLDAATAAVQAGRLPPPEVGKDCRWCAWRATCEAERNT